jgi:hypothetical protein
MKEQRAILWERAGILLFCAAYLWIFNRVLPHGDALRIVRQIEASDLIWNPNHLLFDPLGYGFHHLLAMFGSGLDTLGGFELLSAITTLISMWLFHAVLVRAGVLERSVRLLASAALFASASFVAVAISQYFFMVQMPFLIGALYLYVNFLQTRAPSSLYGMGVLLAIATGIMFNNLLLVIFAGVAVGMTQASWRSFEWRNSLRFWAAAAAVGFPIFITGYLLSHTDSNLITWVLSYEGTEGGGLNEHYGMKWTASRIAQGVAMVGFNFSLGNMVENAGLGTVLAVLVFGNTLEFVPQWGKIALSLAVALPVILLHAWLVWYALRNFGRNATVRLLTLWTAAYLLFNFLWNVGDEIFWLQMLPALWLLVLITQRAARHLDTSAAPSQLVPGHGRFNALAVLVALLLVVNTLTAVLPVSSGAFATHQAEHTRMLREGDLEIVPGWDQQKWMAVEDGGPDVRKLLLMNMAVSTSGEPLDRLPELIDEQLGRNGRVIVGRLFDKDEDLMPWYSLADLGWPRQKIQALLAGYCTRPLDEIGGIVFRELYRCDKPATAG